MVLRHISHQASSGRINNLKTALRQRVGFLALALGTLLLTGLATPVQATTGINPQINFQGRLLNAAGAVVADGNYNLEFKIYQDGPGNVAGDTGGTLKWTEDWLGQAGNAVVVRNGYFSVNLGSITSLAGVDFTQNTLWLSMNIGSTSAVCTPFSACSGDGEMLPMKRLTATPYSFYSQNSGQLGGLSASAFGQLSSNNTFTGTNLFQTTSATALQVAAGANAVFTVDTSGNNILIGKAGALTGTLLFNNATGANSVGLQAAPSSASYTLSLPTSAPGTSQCLQAGSTTATSLTWGACGSSGTLQADYNNYGASAAIITLGNNTGNPGAITVRDASTALGTNLLQVQNNAGTVTYFGVGATGLTVQDTNGAALAFDSTSNTLKVYENVASPTNFASISYSSGAAIFAASSGTTQIGSGSGNVTGNLTGATDVYSFGTTLTAGGAYNQANFSVQRTVSGGANALGGSLLKITDSSSANAGITINPTLLLLNQASTTGTISGNLLDAQLAGTSKFKVDTGGNVTSVGNYLFAGSGSVTASSTGTLTLDTTGAGTVTLGANATTINVGDTTNVARTVNIANSPNNSTVNIATNSGSDIVNVGTNTTGSNTIKLGGTGGSGNSNAGTTVLAQGGQTSLSVANVGLTVQTFTNSTTAFQVQNASSAPILLVDTSTTSNLVTNPGFEVNVTTGWTYTTATGTQNTTKSNTYHGAASDSVNITTANGSANVTGFTAAVTPAQYTFSFYAMKGTNAGTLSVAITGGSAPACTLVNYVAPVTTGFQRYTCTFTSTTSNVTQIAIKSSATGTFFLDAVELNTGAAADPYGAQGAIQLRGIINNPLALQNTADSTTAFQIQNAAGTSNLLVADTLNGRVGIGMNNPVKPLDVFAATTDILRVGNNTSSAAAIVLDANEAGSTNAVRLQVNYAAPNNDFLIQAGGSTRFQITGSTGAVTLSNLSTAGIVTNTAAGLLGTTATIAPANGGTGLNTSGSTGVATVSAGTWSIPASLAANLGGTGQTSYAVGDMLYASAATTLSKLADVATGNVLISGGVGVAPSWGKVGLTTHVSGILPVANGGTNISSYTVGALLYASASTTVSQLADVATGSCLTSGGVGVAPAWGSCGSGGTLQAAYTASTGGTTPEITLDSTRGGVDIQNNNATPISGSLFAVRTNTASGLGPALFNVNSSGSSTSPAVSMNSATGNCMVCATVAPGNIPNAFINTDFENGDTSGWSATGSAAISSVTTQHMYGFSALQITVGATAGSGASVSTNGAFTGSYYLSFFAKGDASFSTLQVTGGPTCTLSSTAITTNWSRYWCSMALSSSYTFTFSTSDANHTLYLDAVQLSGGNTTSSPVPYLGQGKILVDGIISSPVAIWDPSTGSSTAFSVADVFGNPVLNISTVGNPRICMYAWVCNGNESLGISGNAVASGGFATGTPDIAEYITASDNAQAYDVVSADPAHTEQVQKSSRPYDNSAVGVISDGTSGFMMKNPHYGQSIDLLNGEPPAEAKPMTLAGRIPVHVTNEGGAIAPGDYLTTSSTPGYAMKAAHAGPTIGKALGFFDQASGTVLALINISYYDPSSGDNIQGNNAQLGSLTVNGAMSAGSMNVGGLAGVEQLAVKGSAAIGGDLNVAGTTTVVDLVINGHVITGGAAPVVTALSAAGQNAAVTVDGNDTSGTITITAGDPAVAATKTTLAVPGPAAGDIIRLAFAKAFAKAPRVIISPAEKSSVPAGAYVAQSAEDGFVVSFYGTPQANTQYRFNYWVSQ